MKVFLALCGDCRPMLPMPFGSRADRDEWVSLHKETGHNVVIPIPPFDTADLE